MSVDTDRLIQQLKEAMNVAKDDGSDCYVLDRLHIAIKIIESGPDADAKEITKKILDSYW